MHDGRDRIRRGVPNAHARDDRAQSGFLIDSRLRRAVGQVADVAVSTRTPAQPAVAGLLASARAKIGVSYARRPSWSIAAVFASLAATVAVPSVSFSTDRGLCT